MTNLDGYTLLLGYMLLFVAVGVGFIFVHLVVGKFVRPSKPETEKLTIYECGEPTIGSSWIQFDLRFYVVALLFVIFDVEVAFFFPWAVVFGKANALADPSLQGPEREQIVRELAPPVSRNDSDADKRATGQAGIVMKQSPESASALAWIAFFDILVFFGVLLVGFAYLWRRGDLDWVRSVAAEKAAEVGSEGAERETELAGAGAK